MDNKNAFRKAGLQLAYPVAYLYVYFIMPFVEPTHKWIYPTLFSIIFIAWNEIVLRGRKDKSDKRSYFWYAIMFLTALTSAIAPNFALSIFALHLCAVYAVLISNNTLVEGKTGSYIWLDIFRAVCIVPLFNIGELFKGFKENAAIKPEVKETKKFSFAWIIPACILIPFFIVAMTLLSSINKDFANIWKEISGIFNIFKLLNPRVIGRFIVRMIMAFPICIFLFAIVSSSARSKGEKELEMGNRCKKVLEQGKIVTSTASGIITGIFASMYLLFFIVEFKYIFGGLMGVLPEGFNVVEYARRGFFELVGIMAINMLVYVVINIFENSEEGKIKFSKGLMILLMFESILFAVVSLSKLLMYFRTFGYTPKRMLAMWGTVILAAAAIVVIISIIKRKSYIRFWILFAAVSYILMSIAAGIFTGIGYHGEAGLTQRGAYTVTVGNESGKGIYRVAIYADGELIYNVSEADNSPVITNKGEEEFTISAEDLPEGSNLTTAELEFEFFYDDQSNNSVSHYITRVREEDEIGTLIVTYYHRTEEIRT